MTNPQWKYFKSHPFIPPPPSFHLYLLTPNLPPQTRTMTSAAASQSVPRHSTEPTTVPRRLIGSNVNSIADAPSALLAKSNALSITPLATTPMPVPPAFSLHLAIQTLRLHRVSLQLIRKVETLCLASVPRPGRWLGLCIS